MSGPLCWVEKASDRLESFGYKGPLGSNDGRGADDLSSHCPVTI